MEYSLKTILYFFELQAKEKNRLGTLHYTESYPFCCGVEFKQEVLDYLTKWDNDNLRRILKKQIEICRLIIDKWDNELVNLKLDHDMLIYCDIIKNSSFPFSFIKLARCRLSLDSAVYEFGNVFLEDNRYWITVDERYYFDSIIIQKDDSKMTLPDLFIDFVCEIYHFLNDYLSANPNTSKSDTLIDECATTPKISNSSSAFPSNTSNNNITLKNLLRFDSDFSESEHKILYHGLIDEGYLSSKSDFLHFRFVHGYGDNVPDDFVKLRWCKDVQDLKAYIDTFFLSQEKKWKKTVFCFSDNGHEINYNSIRNLKAPINHDIKSKAFFEELKRKVKV